MNFFCIFLTMPPRRASLQWGVNSNNQASPIPQSSYDPLEEQVKNKEFLATINYVGSRSG